MKKVQAIKCKEKIIEMREVLKNGMNTYHKKNTPIENMRNELLFVLGINTGLRISDIIKLRFVDLMQDCKTIKNRIVINEQKTSKNKDLVLNTKITELLLSYYNKYNFVLDDYIFCSTKKGSSNKSISRQQAYNILNKASYKVGLDDIGTHTLRKTFGYHAFKNGTSLELLMYILNHSKPEITLSYIGITEDDAKKVYNELQLG